MKKTVATWSARLVGYRIYTNAFALMVSAAGSGLLGLLYWYVAAHLASPKFLGRAAAEIAAVTLLSTLAQLSFGSVFQRFLPRAGAKSRNLVITGYVTSVGTAFVVGIAYVALGFSHRFFAPSINWSVLFVATIVFYTVFALEDAVLIFNRENRLVFASMGRRREYPLRHCKTGDLAASRGLRSRPGNRHLLDTSPGRDHFCRQLVHLSPTIT